VERAFGGNESTLNIEQAIEQISRQKRDAVDKLRLFDVNIWMGKPLHFPLAQELNIDLLPDVLSRYHIHGGLLSHWDGAAISAQDGNRALVELGQRLPDQVYTIWTGLPLVPREQEPLPGFGEPDSRLRGVRLFPATHRYTLSPWVVGDLCTWCMQYGLPLFLWHVEVEWESLYNLAKAFPDLKIIVESQWQKILYHNRTLYGLMRDHANVYLEISNCIGQDFLTHAVTTFGAGRFVYGSFMPQNDPFASAGMLLDADITVRDKVRVAGENIRDMIQGGMP
jgi:hypothetical protein